MVFSSPFFLFVFLPAALALVAISPWRNPALLALSLVFYAWGEGYFLILMLAVIAVAWFGALIMRRQSLSAASRRYILWATIAGLLTPLAIYKYAEFLFSSWAPVIPQLLGAPIHLPLGISFFTFQAISYVVDLYRQPSMSRPSFLDTATYIALFPQLVAGPIVRFAMVATQLRRPLLRPKYVVLGALFFVFGLAQKVLIADVVAAAPDTLFAAGPGVLDFQRAWLAAFGYAIQIFFDFAGYSNMAIGLGLMLGFRFPRNFNTPYISQSITEFWRRWHMSLSSWFRDYLYIPLGGNRLGRWKTYRNLWIVFLVTGLWHGAAWTFVIWGLYHGAWLVLERAGLSGLLNRLPSAARVLYALLVVIFGWVIFRAESAAHALSLWSAMVWPWTDGSNVINDYELMTAVNAKIWTAMIVGAVLATPLPQRAFEHMLRLPLRIEALQAYRDVVTPKKAVIMAGVVGVLGVICAVAVLSSTYSPFLYFRF